MPSSNNQKFMHWQIREQHAHKHKKGTNDAPLPCKVNRIHPVQTNKTKTREHNIRKVPNISRAKWLTLPVQRQVTNMNTTRKHQSTKIKGGQWQNKNYNIRQNDETETIYILPKRHTKQAANRAKIWHCEVNLPMMKRQMDTGVPERVSYPCHTSVTRHLQMPKWVYIP